MTSMRRADHDLLTDLLRACFNLAPRPLYPAAFAQEHGVERAALDRALDELRLRGLVRLTEWVQGMGQGYTLTPAGLELVEHPTGLRPGAPLPKAPPPVENVHDEAERPPLPLIRPGRPVVSITLIAINVAIFIVSETSLTPVPRLGERIFQEGALTPDAVLRQHEWWRLLSYAFLHGGILHIFFNMYFLYSLGPVMEAMWGSGRTLLLYLVSAVAGGCFVVWIGRVAPDTPTIGASGALCGLLASLGVWVMLNREYLPPALARSLSRNVTINLVFIAIMSFMIPNVSWEGHLGGAVGGALASFPLQVSRYASTWPRRINGIIGTVLVGVVFVLLVLSRTWGLKPPF